MAVFLGYIIAWIIVIGFIVAIVSGIKAAYRFRTPKELLTNGDFERYYKTVPLNGVKMPLPQTLSATEIEAELKSNNLDDIVYEEFQAFAKKRFVVTKEGLIYEGRIISYEYLSFVSIYFSPTPLTCGIAQIMINGELTYLYYKFRDRERAKISFNYMNTLANPEEPWPPSLIYWKKDIEELNRNNWKDSLKTEEEFDKG